MALTQVASGLIASVSGSTITGSQSIPKSTLPTGSVLQVVNAVYGTGSAGVTTSASFVDTGLTASITPSSSTSKILVTFNLSGIAKNGGNTAMGVQLVRGSTAILGLNGIAGYEGTTGYNGVGDIGTTYLDSPATTSSTTYKVQALTFNAGSVYWNQIYTASYTVSSTITLMEIAA
jgi:hypothetical protein